MPPYPSSIFEGLKNDNETFFEINVKNVNYILHSYRKFPVIFHGYATGVDVVSKSNEKTRRKRWLEVIFLGMKTTNNLQTNILIFQQTTEVFLKDNGNLEDIGVVNNCVFYKFS